MGVSDKARLTMVMAGATLGSCVVGFSSAIIATTLNQPGFYKTMGLPMSPTEPGYSETTTIISAANGVFYAGAAIGTIAVSWPAERFGRVISFRVTSVFHIVACALQAGSVNRAMYLVSRLLAGFAVGQGTGIMTTYYSEMSLPQSRGLLGGLHGLGIEIGAFTSAWIGLGCYYSSNTNFAWRFPIALVCPLAMTLLVVTFFLPETPRWLIRNGRADDALNVLESLHYDERDPQIAAREFQQIKIQTEADAIKFGAHPNRVLFTDRNYFKRLCIAFGLVAFVQSNGILLIYNYSAIIYTTLGLTNAAALAISAGWITWTAVCLVGGNLISDRFSRKYIMMLGFLGCSSCLAIYTACLSRYLATQETKWAVLSVVFIFLDMIPYGLCLGSNQFTVPTEFFPNHLRAVASAIAISALYLIQVLWLNVGPLALSRVSWKFYCTFVSLGFTGIFYVFFFVPNTVGLPLEEIDTVFGRKVEVRLDEIDNPGAKPPVDVTEVHHAENKEGRDLEK